MEITKDVFKVRKVLLVLVLLLSISVPGWTQEYKIKPGVVVTKGNYKKYIPELKRLLTPPDYATIINGLANGWITVPVKERDKIPMPGIPYPYGEASIKYNNAEKCKVGPRNELIGWVAGKPFPTPKTAAEFAWNFKKRNMTDQSSFFADFLLYDKEGRKTGKPERTFRWHLYDRWWSGRVVVPPLPEEPGNNGLIYQKEALVIIEPYDIKGFAQVRINYTSIDRSDEVYSYIPAIRRIRRLTGNDMTDPLMGSDTCQDDLEVMRQKFTSKMTFKVLGTKDILTSKYYLKKPPEPFVRGDCYQIDWEIRPFYILEVNLNDPSHAYSKRILYCENDHHSADACAGMCFDQKGRFWRSAHYVIHGWIKKYKDFKCNNIDYWYGGLFMDHISDHVSQMIFEPIYGDPKAGPNAFTMKFLLQEAR